MKTNYIIKDWAGNDIFLPQCPHLFKSWDDAEEHLSTFLGDSYDESRGEYYILEYESTLVSGNGNFLQKGTK